MSLNQNLPEPCFGIVSAFVNDDQLSVMLGTLFFFQGIQITWYGNSTLAEKYYGNMRSGSGFINSW